MTDTIFNSLLGIEIGYENTKNDVFLSYDGVEIGYLDLFGNPIKTSFLSIEIGYNLEPMRKFGPAFVIVN
jgi:hypothetical protein